MTAVEFAEMVRMDERVRSWCDRDCLLVETDTSVALTKNLFSECKCDGKLEIVYRFFYNWVCGGKGRRYTVRVAPNVRTSREKLRSMQGDCLIPL